MISSILTLCLWCQDEQMIIQVFTILEEGNGVKSQFKFDRETELLQFGEQLGMSCLGLSGINNNQNSVSPIDWLVVFNLDFVAISQSGGSSEECDQTHYQKDRRKLHFF